MKSCPTCNRTYPDDTLAFCLMDGSILSAPFDETGKAVPPDRDSSPPPTEVLTGAPERVPLPQTRAATPENFRPTITAPPPATPQLPTDNSTRSVTAKRSVLPKVLTAVAVVAAAAVLGAVVLLVLSKSGKRNNPEVDVSIKTPVDASSSSAAELRIRITYNVNREDCDLGKVFLISWSVDGGRSEVKELDRGDEVQVTAKQSFSLNYLGYQHSLHKCMGLTINDRRAKLPTDKEIVLITTDNYQQFLE